MQQLSVEQDLNIIRGCVCSTNISFLVYGSQIMGLLVDRQNEDGTERGAVKGRIPGDATRAEMIEGAVIFIVLVAVLYLIFCT